ncbi:unnamed protein product [Absidia cylindrospora]
MEIEKFSGHFWSCDLKGVEKLMDYVKNAYDELDQLHEIYVARAELEHSFGQKLEKLAKPPSTFSSSTSIEDDSNSGAIQKGVPGSIAAVHKELQNLPNLTLTLQNDFKTVLPRIIKFGQKNITMR